MSAASEEAASPRRAHCTHHVVAVARVRVGHEVRHHGGQRRDRAQLRGHVVGGRRVEGIETALRVRVEEIDHRIEVLEVVTPVFACKRHRVLPLKVGPPIKKHIVAADSRNAIVGNVGRERGNVRLSIARAASRVRGVPVAAAGRARGAVAAVEDAHESSGRAAERLAGQPHALVALRQEAERLEVRILTTPHDPGVARERRRHDPLKGRVAECCTWAQRAMQH